VVFIPEKTLRLCFVKEYTMNNLTSEQELVKALAIKLGALGVTAKYLRREIGPVVTTYYFQLGLDIPLAKIINKSEDLALAVGVESILVFRKGGEIAVEIPNPDRKIVGFDTCLFELFKNPEYNKLNLPIMLGVDSHGRGFNLDLVEQPHILVAGSTGGGKSILLSTIIGALAITKDAKEVKMMLVDTKKLDLPLFQNLPHVVENVEDAEEFHRIMDRLMKIVRKRTEQMRGIARNITEYNSLVTDSTQKLPYYVVIIDELADLIDDDEGRAKSDEVYKKQYLRIPKRIKALVQICRAAGIHIVAATQRSSVKVINGDIKANFPTRIALRLPTRADSTTILSGGGAENLLGKGDMLIESPAFPNFKRAHGAFVSNSDIARILNDADRIREQLVQFTQA
jgi:S-DNA-T family DNA segregation ATPase FtsK/SpoIIIE